MRIIKFRGFQKTWIYGGISVFENEATIFDINCVANSAYEVDIKSIGQFTGLQDKNGKDIYENDILTFTRNVGNWQVGKSIPFISTHQIVWEQEISAFVLKDNSGYIKFRKLNGKYIYEVIGNIHENPELLSTPTAVL